MSKALVILSGGQDSTTCLFWAKKNFDEVHAVTFYYGQRHVIELDAAEKVAEIAGVESHEFVEIPNCLKSTSPLTSDTKLEKYESFEQMEKTVGKKVESTFVPMRNMLFFAIAMNRAIYLGCDTLVTGICATDNANYPDCTAQFLEAFNHAASTSLGVDNFQVVAPLLFNTKCETVEMAYEMPDCWKALAYSHTSYDGKYPPTDNNHSNILRAQGFLEAGLPDPLVVRAVVEGLMPMPTTKNYREELFDETQAIIGI